MTAESHDHRAAGLIAGAARALAEIDLAAAFADLARGSDWWNPT
ncbi:MAG: hypothetical protein R3D56_13150 [Paracoccaceae bacterium]